MTPTATGSSRSWARAAVRCAWKVYAFVILSNHLHVVLKTPQPNLARGMQAFLSTYANAWARRHRFCGHVFQGRYRTELVEDETYLWTVTRYVHLNPVRAAWSSILRPGGGRAIRAMPIGVAVWSGWRTTSYWRPGRGSSAGRTRRERTGGMSPRDWSSRPSRRGGRRYQGWVLGSRGVRRSGGGDGAGPIRDAERRAGVALDARDCRWSGFARWSVRSYEISLVGVEPSREPAPGASGLGLRGTAADDGDQRRTDGAAGRVAAGERAQPDAAVRSWLTSDVRVREQFNRIEEELVLGTPEKTRN